MGIQINGQTGRITHSDGNVKIPSSEIGISQLSVANNAFVAGIMTVTSDLNVSGNIAIGGTLTYEDVTNVDSIGIITARNGIDVTGQTELDNLNVSGVSTFQGDVKIGDDDELIFGAGQDLQIFHNSSSNNSVIQETGSGNLNIDADNLQIRNSAGNEFIAKFITDGAVELYYDNSKKFETTGAGATVFGTLETQQLNVSGVSTFQGNVHLGDNDKIRLGDGGDLEIFHDSGNNYVAATSGSLFIRGSDLVLEDAGGNDYITCSDGGAGGTVTLKHLGSTKLETTTTGAKVTGALEVTQEYPSIRPTLDLNFAATKTLDRRITFTRDSIGTYVDDMGIIKYASNNVPRFDHDPDTGESLGLLLEEERKNHTYNSLNYSGSWTQSRGTLTGITTITSPDGTTDGIVLFAEDTQTGPHHFKAPENTPTETIADGTTVTSSIWVKKYGSKQYIQFGINKKDDSYARTTVDLDTGTLSNTATGYTATSTAYPNGWYRITVTGDGGTGSGKTAPVNSLFLVENGSSSTSSYTGDGSSGVYVWGPQMEIGSFATSFIPTRDSNTVTRVADLATIKGTNFTDFYNYAEGSVSLEYSIQGPKTTDGFNRLFQFDDSTSNNRYTILLVGTTESIYDSFSIGGSQNLDFNTSTINFNNFYKVSAGFKQNDYYRYTFNANGEVDSLTDTSLDFNNFTPTQLSFYESDTNDRQLCGHIKYFKYYNKRLPNAQLQGLTQQ